MLSILGSILGFGSSLIPTLVKFFQDKKDKEHELKLLEIQMQMQAAGHTQRLEEINANADIEESKALYQSAQPILSGVRWVDAVISFMTSSVRPMITYAFFALYAWVKAAQYVKVKDVATIWSQEDMAIFCTIVSFWFGARTMQRFFKK
jgi:small neutral amino acid transporter SnatA (MarC family)